MTSLPIKLEIALDRLCQHLALAGAEIVGKRPGMLQLKFTRGQHVMVVELLIKSREQVTLLDKHGKDREVDIPHPWCFVLTFLLEGGKEVAALKYPTATSFPLDSDLDTISGFFAKVLHAETLSRFVALDDFSKVEEFTRGAQLTPVVTRANQVAAVIREKTKSHQGSLLTTKKPETS